MIQRHATDKEVSDAIDKVQRKVFFAKFDLWKANAENAPKEEREKLKTLLADAEKEREDVFTIMYENSLVRDAAKIIKSRKKK